MVVIAALQDPRKEVMPFRDLFPTRIALALVESDQTDLVLGRGARTRGADCSRIPLNAGDRLGVVRRRARTHPRPGRLGLRRRHRRHGRRLHARHTRPDDDGLVVIDLTDKARTGRGGSVTAPQSRVNDAATMAGV